MVCGEWHLVLHESNRRNSDDLSHQSRSRNETRGIENTLFSLSTDSRGHSLMCYVSDGRRLDDELDHRDEGENRSQERLGLPGLDLTVQRGYLTAIKIALHRIQGE